MKDDLSFLNKIELTFSKNKKLSFSNKTTLSCSDKTTLSFSGLTRESSKKIFYFISPLFLFIFIILACNFGVKTISLFSIINKTCSPLDFAVMTKIRLPRIALCVLCGALLGGTGAVFQGFFRNPLADCGIMGVSSGASFGAVLSGIFTFPILSEFLVIAPISVFAFFGASLSCFCVFIFSKVFKESSSVSLLLSGTAVGTFFSSITSIILLTQKENFHAFYSWTMGSFNAKTWNDFFIILIPSILSFVLLPLCAKHLDVLICGEKSAISLGMNYKKVRFLVLFAGSLATSCAVIAGGIISFVGLIAPHIVRKIFGAKHKVLIFQSMIFGSIITLVSDIICRTVISPSELPVGVVTSLIGVPFFIFALVKGNK